MKQKSSPQRFFKVLCYPFGQTIGRNEESNEHGKNKVMQNMFYTNGLPVWSWDKSLSTKDDEVPVLQHRTNRKKIEEYTKYVKNKTMVFHQNIEEVQPSYLDMLDTRANNGENKTRRPQKLTTRETKKNQKILRKVPN